MDGCPYFMMNFSGWSVAMMSTPRSTAFWFSSVLSSSPQDKCQYLQVVLAAFLYELRGKGVNPDDSDVGMQFLYDMLYVLFTFDVGLQGSYLGCHFSEAFGMILLAEGEVAVFQHAFVLYQVQ